MPTVSAASGCSPTDRIRSPQMRLEQQPARPRPPRSPPGRPGWSAGTAPGRRTGCSTAREWRSVSQHGSGVVLVGRRLDQLVEQEAGDADGQQVEHDAEHHLVDQVVIANSGQQRRHRHAGQHRRDQRRRDRLGDAADDRRRERGGQELALDRHVDHAGAFAEHAAQRAEDQRGGQRQRAGELVGDRERQVAAGRRPGEEADDDREAGDDGGDHGPDRRASDRTGTRPRTSRQSTAQIATVGRPGTAIGRQLNLGRRRRTARTAP